MTTAQIIILAGLTIIYILTTYYSLPEKPTANQFRCSMFAFLIFGLILSIAVLQTIHLNDINEKQTIKINKAK
jgi:hypothetical protein